MSAAGGEGEDFECSDVALALDADVDGALGLLQAGFERLLEIGDRGDFCALGPRRLIDVAQRFERHRSRLQAIDVAIIEAAREEGLAGYTCHRTLPMAWAALLRISQASARAQVARAEQLMAEHAFSTGTATAQLPALAEAIRAGDVTGDQVAVIGTAMKKLRTNPELSAAESAQAEQILLAQASSLGPDDLRTVAARLDEVLLPDGVQPRDDLAQARRGLSLGPERRDGTHSITGSLTRSAYARLMSVLSPLAAPRPAEDPMGADARTGAQRMHDALADAASRLLDSAGLPRSGGTPATVHVTIDIDQLLTHLRDTNEAANATGDTTHSGSTGASGSGSSSGWGDDEAARRAAGTTSFGQQLTFGEIIQLAEQARIIPVFLSSSHGIVAYGATRRCASEAQTQALIARDKGCSFPGCDAPPQWCERHHIIPWYRGGPTDLDNLTLVCGYHHREFDKRGWRVTMSSGIPVWIPPAWIDRQQRPMINTRIHGADPLTLEELTLEGAQPDTSADATKPPAHADETAHADKTSDADKTDNGGDDGEGEGLDHVPDLLDLLALHIQAEEREEFHYEIDLLLDSYIGPNAPANRHLEPVA